jgi:hypothetical protein
MTVEPYFAFQIPRKKLIQGLFIATGTLIAAHILVHVVHYKVYELSWLFRHYFDVNHENSLPTWFSTMLHFTASMLLFTVAINKRSAQDDWTLYWFGLAFGFLILSMDEVAGVHEKINTATSFSWVIPGGVVAAMVGLAYIRFLLRLPFRTRWLFVISGAIFLLGALGVEYLSIWLKNTDLLSKLEYHLWTAAEEALEMSGIVLFIHAILGYIGDTEDPRVEIYVEEETS